jgi:hypothetical protein
VSGTRFRETQVRLILRVDVSVHALIHVALIEGVVCLPPKV